MPAHASIVPIPPGDCRASPNAEGRWAVAGEDRGSIVCYIDGPTGDALLDWTYDRDALLVRARNPRGDSAALYAFFDRYARFIEP
jgi:hypothetical protein